MVRERLVSFGCGWLFVTNKVRMEFLDVSLSEQSNLHRPRLCFQDQQPKQFMKLVYMPVPAHCYCGRNQTASNTKRSKVFWNDFLF